MHDSESIPENERHKVIRDFEIKTNHLISARRPNIVIVNKKKKKERERELPNSGLCSHGRPHNKVKSKRKER